VSEQILSGRSAQLGYTVPFTSVHAGKYRTEDKLKTDTTKTKHNSEQESCAIAKITARCALYEEIVSCCGDMAIQNYPRWRRPPS